MNGYANDEKLVTTDYRIIIDGESCHYIGRSTQQQEILQPNFYGSDDGAESMVYSRTEWL